MAGVEDLQGISMTLVQDVTTHMHEVKNGRRRMIALGSR